MSLVVVLTGFSFLLGLVIGSFLNVVICRYNTGETLWGRSRCFTCGRELSFKELFPLLSFLIQKGKCRNCLSKISWQYPIVEFLTALLFALSFLKISSGVDISMVTRPSFWAALFSAWAFIAILIVIAVYDYRHKIIPDFLVVLAIFLGLLGAWLSLERSGFANQMIFALHGLLLAGPTLALPLAGLWFISYGRWLGLGDAKLAYALGVFLGLSRGIVAFLLSFWIGAIIGLILIILGRFQYLWFRKFSLKSELPFAPFLIAGALLSWLLPANWLSWLIFF
ncbi:MAG TPA: prepilin peptidase [Candidatus Vogelbacteria bacterium]|nr:prepilin peptidase [Candidatus Vogelbacteria bacterium]